MALKTSRTSNTTYGPTRASLGKKMSGEAGNVCRHSTCNPRYSCFARTGSAGICLFVLYVPPLLLSSGHYPDEKRHSWALEPPTLTTTTAPTGPPLLCGACPFVAHSGWPGGGGRVAYSLLPPSCLRSSVCRCFCCGSCWGQSD